MVMGVYQAGCHKLAMGRYGPVCLWRGLRILSMGMDASVLYGDPAACNFMATVNIDIGVSYQEIDSHVGPFGIPVAGQKLSRRDEALYRRCEVRIVIVKGIERALLNRNLAWPVPQGQRTGWEGHELSHW
ncbi:hypothetical protein AA0614_1483 [Komagataeibacter saccharivorans NRIC 0614]|nr:hypothetical protein AA0614_1483 [Komagataeibacter saccharivorans NRIC 0614]